MGGASLSPGWANFIEDAARIRRNQTDADKMSRALIIASVGQHKKLKDFLSGHRRAAMREMTMVTGAREVESQYGAEWVADPMCPDTRVYNLTEENFATAVLQELTYVDNGAGGKFFLRPTGLGASSGDVYDHVYDGAMCIVFDFLGRSPHLQGALTNLSKSDVLAKSDFWYTV
jgi:hypothetical protein